ncbi:Rpn family recombination-promoting nuclease/putative transposase [Clostridium sp. DJ247]|uniref:Rpn family recombination-promoting nuclease/putative transposase n=1 Tax=Clostridium sp. DJ247 TaxID=2726188 RepID=UPI001F4CE2D0|nr:Rpn family recombination-promoting nuclease/putative transposase [Clostridium sp. DJ247]
MLTDLVEIHFIEVSKFNELKEKNLKEDRLQRWLTFFNNDISEEKLKELMDMDSDIKKAEERLEYLSSDAKTIEIYKAREKSLHERANMISSAMEEGENKKAIEIAKNLLDVLDIETIAIKTGLSVEEVKKLKH